MKLCKICACTHLIKINVIKLLQCRNCNIRRIIFLAIKRTLRKCYLTIRKCCSFGLLTKMYSASIGPRKASGKLEFEVISLFIELSSQWSRGFVVSSKTSKIHSCTATWHYQCHVAVVASATLLYTWLLSNKIVRQCIAVLPKGCQLQVSSFARV